MRVLFVTTLRHTPDSFGGSQQSTNQLCEHLATRGHQVAVSAARGRRGRTADLVHRLGVRLRSRPIADHDHGFPVYRLVDPVKQLAAVVRQERPDVAVIQAGQQGALSAALDRLGVPFVLYLRDALDHVRPPRVARGRFTVVANSQFTANVHRARGGTVDAVIPPLVEPTRYLTSGTGTHVTLVNPNPLKGGWLALDLARRNPDIPFLFQEGWNEAADMRAEAAGLTNVEFVPPKHDMRSTYQRTRLLLVPSGAQYGTFEEAWGRVVTEGHVSGIPAIATEGAGLTESLGPGGLLVPRTAGFDAWNEALHQLWYDRALYDRMSARALDFSKRTEIRPATLLQQVERVLVHTAALRG